MLAVALFVFSSPVGVVVNGVVSGLIVSLVAVSIVLVHRSARVVNFAAADIGLAGAVGAALASEQSGLPWLLALPTAVAGGVLTGLAAEVVVLRRFFRAPRLIITVLTLGMSQLLVFGALQVPKLWGVRLAAQRVAPPFDGTFEIGAFTYSSAHAAAVVVCPVVLVALGAVLRFSRVGVAVRAIADLPDRAATLGVPVLAMQSVVWGAAGGLAALALFLEAGVNGLPLSGRLGYTLLLSSLAAAVLGRFTHLATVVAASVALGVLQQAVSWNVVDNTTAPNTALGVVIIVAMLLQRRERDRFEETSVWRTAATARAVPAALRGLAEVRGAKAVIAAAGAVAVYCLPRLLGVQDLLRASTLLLFGIVGLSLVVLSGWGGQISLGQIGFVALGAAVAGKATLSLGADLLAGTLLAGVAGSVAAVVIGVPALRLRGTQLAVTTLAFSVAATSWLLDPQLSDWVPDERLERLPILGRIDYTSPEGIYWVSVAAFAVSAVVVVRLRQSRFGRALIASRDNPDALAVYGVRVLGAQLGAFATSGFLAAAAGALYVHHQQNFDIGSYHPDTGVALFMAVVIGGAGSALGGFLGIAYWLGSQWWLEGSWRILSTGAGVILILAVLPEGLAGAFYRGRDRGLRWVAARRRIDVPALQTTDHLDHLAEQRRNQEELRRLMRDATPADKVEAELR